MNLFKKLLALKGLSILPNNCLLCGLISHKGRCCAGCEADLPWLEYACGRCGYALYHPSPLGMHVDAKSCGECLKRSPPYDNTIALFRYEPPMDHVLLSIKFKRHLAYARMLGEMMVRKVEMHYRDRPMPELILPVPLHNQRLKTRGYNQALEIVRPVAKRLKIPLSLHDCMRTVETQPQATVPAEEREQNIKKAFLLVREVRAQHVAIFDDVVTTGSTVAEITRVLKKAGVARVDVWCCARTLL
jgi:ComF family protein